MKRTLARGHAELVERVRLLDEGRSQRDHPRLRDDVEHFIDIMEQLTSNTSNPLYAHQNPRATPARADAIMRTSRLLARLDAGMPEIVTGPIRRDAQYWISWGLEDTYRERRRVLDTAYFVGALDAAEIVPSTKPFYVGLYTSTAVLGTYGMWHMVLDSFNGSGLYALPWDVWLVEPEPDAAVLELAGAADWVDFVTTYPQPVHRTQRGDFPRRPPGETGPYLYPDWKAVAERWDGVHMTLRAIVATQGVFFPTAGGVVAPTFWDVESTFWLRWCFRAVQHVETIELPGELG